MIHSASFFATGSDMAASAWVASAGLCLRISSMTFSSASVSACEVDDVAATAAGVVGLRAIGGGNAACCRVAGAMAGATGAAPAVFLAAILGTTLRAIGRGFGSGTFGLVLASAVNADKPTASARVVARLVVKTANRNAAARVDGVTTFPDGES